MLQDQSPVDRQCTHEALRHVIVTGYGRSGHSSRGSRVFENDGVGYAKFNIGELNRRPQNLSIFEWPVFSQARRANQLETALLDVSGARSRTRRSFHD